jgi:hypothetical protein
MTGASNLSNKSHLLTAISAAGGGMQVGQLKDGAFNCQFCGALLPGWTVLKVRLMFCRARQPIQEPQAKLAAGCWMRTCVFVIATCVV